MLLRDSGESGCANGLPFRGEDPSTSETAKAYNIPQTSRSLRPENMEKLSGYLQENTSAPCRSINNLSTSRQPKAMLSPTFTLIIHAQPGRLPKRSQRSWNLQTCAQDRPRRQHDKTLQPLKRNKDASSYNSINNIRR